MLPIQKKFIVWFFFVATLLMNTSLASASEFGPPDPLIGTFVFVDQFRPVMKVDVRRVYGFTKKGREKLEALREQGYRCRALQRQTYRCVQQQELKDISDSIRSRAFQKIEGHLWFDFLDVRTSVEEVVNNETYKMWKVIQPVSTDYGTYEEYEWSWTPSNSKITFRGREKGDLPTLYLNVGDLNSLNIQFSVSQTIDKNHFEIHIVRALYERGCFVGGFTRPSDRCGESDSVR